MYYRRWAPWIAVVVVGWGWGVMPGGAAGQPLGSFYLEARDAAGAPVDGLRPSDLVVLEDDREAGVISVERADAPMRVALLVDSGDRLAESRGLNSLRDGLTAFLDTLPAPHEVSLLTIARNIQRRVDFTADRTALKQGVGLIFDERGASTVLLDGVRETWERRFDEDDAFPVFVLVLMDGTEGSGNYNDNEYGALVNTLIQNDVSVHTVIVNTRGGSVVSQYSQNLTQNTGGLYTSIVAPTGLVNALTALAARMDEHFDAVSGWYHVVYERPDPPGTSIALRLNRGDVTVRLFASKRIPD